MEEISLWELFAIFKSHKKLIAIVVASVTALGTLLGCVMPKKYVSEFVFSIRPLNERVGFISLSLEYYRFLLENLESNVMSSPGEQLSELSPEFSSEEHAESGIFTVELEDSSAEKAFEAAQLIFKNFIGINNEQLALLLAQYESALKSEEEKLSGLTEELSILTERGGSLEEADAKNKNILNLLNQYSARLTETVTLIEAAEKTLSAWEKDFGEESFENVDAELLLPVDGESPNYILRTENLNSSKELEKLILSVEYSKTKINLSKYREEEMILTERIETLKNELTRSETDFLEKRELHNSLTSLYSQTEANCQSLSAEKNELLLRLSDRNMEGNIQIIKKPEFPEKASSPGILIYFTISLIFAVIIGFSEALFIESYHKIKYSVSK